MSENSNETVDTNAAPYKESDDHVADPTAAFGTLDTSGTAGGANERIENITPVFDAARAQDLEYAADALDPNNDENTDTAAVVLPEDGLSPEDAKKNVQEAADAAAGVKVEDPSLAQAEADNKAKEEGNLTPGDVTAQQQQASPAGGTAGTPSTPGSAADSGTTDTTTGTPDASKTGTADTSKTGTKSTKNR